MLDVLYTELLKLKRSKILWLIAIGALLPAFLSFMLGYSRFRDGMPMGWDSVLLNNATLMNLLMAPALFALVSGFVVAREYQDNTINTLLTYPVPRGNILLGKLAILLAVVASTLLLSFAAILVSGQFVQTEPLTGGVLARHLRITGWTIAAQFALVPIAMGVSLIGRSLLPAIVTGIAAVVASGIVINSERYSLYFPWTIPVRLIFYLAGKDTLDVAKEATILAAVFLLSLVFSLWYFRRADVHGVS